MPKDIPLKASQVTCFGWDMVSSIRIDALNQAIRDGDRTPDGFSDQPETGVTVSGQFEPWQISPDGDGAILSMQMGLHDLTINGSGDAKHFEHGVADVDVRLEFLPHDPHETGPERTMLLVLQAAPDANAMPAVSVTNLSLDGPHKALDVVYVTAALEMWLRKNLSQFSHVLAAVTLYETIEKGRDFSWLKPTYLGYAFGRNSTDPNASILSVLSKTGNRSADGLPLQTLVEAIPDAAMAGFLVSKRRFLRDVIVPGLPAAFPGLREEDLNLLPDDAGLELTKMVGMDAVEYDGDTYHPDLVALDITLYDTFLETKSQTRTKVSLGVWAHCETTGRYKIELIQLADGKRGMKVVQMGDTTTRKWKEVSKGVRITETILLIIAGLAALIITVLTWGFGVAAAAPLYFAMYGGMIGFTALKAAELLSGETSPPLDLLETEIDNTLRWSAGDVFLPTSIGLHYALQIGGQVTDRPSPNRKASSATARAFQDQFSTRMKERANDVAG